MLFKLEGFRARIRFVAVVVFSFLKYILYVVPSKDSSPFDLWFCFRLLCLLYVFANVDICTMLFPRVSVWEARRDNLCMVHICGFLEMMGFRITRHFFCLLHEYLQSSNPCGQLVVQCLLHGGSHSVIESLGFQMLNANICTLA